MHHQPLSATERVMDIVNHNPGCSLEDVLVACPELTWNQVFWEVDRLSRNGQIRLMRQGMSTYTLSAPSFDLREAIGA